MPTKIEHHLREYLDYLEIEKGRSIRTRENYEHYLREFFLFTKVSSPSDITDELVRNYRLALARTPKKKITQNYYLIALRNFLKYLAKRDVAVLAPEKIELPKIPERDIETLDPKDAERLLASPKGDSLRSLRDRAILEALYSTGLRLSELCSLDRTIDITRGEVTVRGKGGKMRLVFLSDRARETIASYLKKRTDPEDPLFISITKHTSPKVIGRITPRSVERIVSFYARAAGIAGRVHPHMFRHFFATDLLINGADLRSVQSLLGHASVSTTQIYTHLTNKELKEIHETFHSRRRKT